MSVIRLPTAAASPVQQPPAHQQRPRFMCEAAGFMRAVRAALHARPDIPRGAIIATANAPAVGAFVNALDIIRAACAEHEVNAA